MAKEEALNKAFEMIAILSPRTQFRRSSLRLPLAGRTSPLT